MNSTFGKLKKSITYLLVVLTPVLMTTIHSFIVGHNLFLGRPHNSDEFCYWRVLYSFEKCGFDFASTCGLVGSDAKIGPLGEHGLATIFAWGPSIVIGPLGEHTLFIWNIIILSISLLVFVILVNPSFRTSLIVILLIVGNGVILEQWYSHMMELPCMAIIIIGISLTIKYNQTMQNRYFIFLIGIVAYASMMRICYIVLLLPALIDFCKTKKIGAICLSIITYLLFFGGIRVFQQLYMKTSESFLSNMESGDGLTLLLDNIKKNMTNYFSLNSGTPVEVGQRYFQVCLIILLIIVAIINSKNKSAYLAQAVSLSGLIFMMIVLYDVSDWRDVRTTMPLALGISIWFAYQMEEELISKLIKGVFILVSLFFLFRYAPYKYVENHPDDRYMEYSVDSEWMAQLSDEKYIICLYNTDIDNIAKFEMYKNIPAKVGILSTDDINKVAENNNIKYVLTAEHSLYSEEYLVNYSEDYGYLFKIAD